MTALDQIKADASAFTIYADARRKEEAERAAWLASLKPGDQVAIANSHPWGEPYMVFTIDKTTPTQLVAGKVRVNRDSGTIRGGGYRQIEPVTPRILETMEAYKLRAWLDRLAAKELTLPQLQAMRKAYLEQGGE